MVNDDVLLAIFDFYVNDFKYLNENLPIKDGVGVWQCPCMCVNDGDVLSLDHHVA